jgi:hypothetical protein
MEAQRNEDRHRRTNDSAYPLQKFTFSVIMTFRNHCAVQIKKDRLKLRSYEPV